MNNSIQQKNRIIAIISMFFPNAKIYLFGSYARGENKLGSDIDIAIDNDHKIDIVELQKIRNMIECLNLIQNTDVVDFHAIPSELQQNIVKDGIVWKK